MLYLGMYRQQTPRGPGFKTEIVSSPGPNFVVFFCENLCIYNFTSILSFSWRTFERNLSTSNFTTQ